MSEELKPCPFWRDGFLCTDFDGRCIEEHCKVLPEIRKRDARIVELEGKVDDLQGELAQSAAVSRITELEAERDRLREALERIKKLSYPDNVCNNCINSEELVSEDWCKLSGKELEDASSQTCEKFTPHIVPEIYVIAQEALKGGGE